MKIFIEYNSFSINKNKNRNNLSKFVIFLILLFLGAIVLSGAVSAANITVNPSSGIQNAINTAHNGDTLKLTAGTYKEHNINVNKNLTLTGPVTKVNGLPTAVINGQKLGRVFNIPKGVKVNLQYLLIQNGNARTDIIRSEGSGGGIFNNGILNIKNCIIQKNSAINGSGGGILNYYSGTMTLTNSNINNNIAGSGGGICDVGFHSSTLTNSKVYNNIAHYYGGGICNGDFDSVPSVMTVTNSKVYNNIANWSGGGIFNSGYLTLTNSHINNNNATNGSGLYNEYGDMLLNNSNVNLNIARAYGGGIGNYYGRVTLNFCRIFRNKANHGYAIYNNGTMTAKFNWWGSNANPHKKIYGKVTFTPWLVLKVKATQSFIKSGGTSKITADLLHDSQGNYHNAIYGHVPNGILANFYTTLGTIITPVSMLNGIVSTTLKTKIKNGIAHITTKIDNQIVKTTVTFDTTAPKVLSTTPINGYTHYSSTAAIKIKFSERIKATTYYKYIQVKNLSTNIYVSINKSIIGNVLYIKTKTNLSAKTWYTVTIPKCAIKDYAGNNGTTYKFKFKTGA